MSHISFESQGGTMSTIEGQTKNQPLERLLPKIVAKDRRAFDQERIDVILLTAVDVELKAVLCQLRPLSRRRAVWRVAIGQETYYLGRFGKYNAVVTMCEK